MAHVDLKVISYQEDDVDAGKWSSVDFLLDNGKVFTASVPPDSRLTKKVKGELCRFHNKRDNSGYVFGGTVEEIENKEKTPKKGGYRKGGYNSDARVALDREKQPVIVAQSATGYALQFLAIKYPKGNVNIELEEVYQLSQDIYEWCMNKMGDNPTPQEVKADANGKANFGKNPKDEVPY